MVKKSICTLALFSISIIIFYNVAQATENFVMARETMVKMIERDVRATHDYLNKEKLDDKVIKQIASVPRHLFVPEKMVKNAYENRPLSIGKGQTISQPYIVAIMTDLLQLTADDSVLEVGTGSGYQAAILSGLVKHVYSVEIVESLGLDAKARLAELGYANVSVKIGDGYYGWEEHAPFDAIIVTAAADHIPTALIQQLKTEGHMIIPVGSPFSTQQLQLFTKLKNGQLQKREIMPVRFVPVTGNH